MKISKKESEENTEQKKESEENTDQNEMSYVESDLYKSTVEKILGFSGFNRNFNNFLGRINCKQPCFH